MELYYLIFKFKVRNLHFQRAKKIVSNSLGLVDFAIRLVNSVLNMPDRQLKFFGEIHITAKRYCTAACRNGKL